MKTIFKLLTTILANMAQAGKMENQLYSITSKAQAQTYRKNIR